MNNLNYGFFIAEVIITPWRWISIKQQQATWKGHETNMRISDSQKKFRQILYAHLIF